MIYNNNYNIDRLSFNEIYADLYSIETKGSNMTKSHKIYAKSTNMLLSIFHQWIQPIAVIVCHY